MNWDLFRHWAATRVIEFAMFATITSDSVNIYLAYRNSFTHTHTHTHTHRERERERSYYM